MNALLVLATFVPAVWASFSGKATFYDLAPGHGVACQIPIGQGDILHAAALDVSVYDHQQACGRCIRVRGPKGFIVARVVDRCEGCGLNGVDLTRQGFPSIANIIDGRVNVQWDFVSCDGSLSKSEQGVSVSAAQLKQAGEKAKQQQQQQQQQRQQLQQAQQSQQQQQQPQQVQQQQQQSQPQQQAQTQDQQSASPTAQDAPAPVSSDSGEATSTDPATSTDGQQDQGQQESAADIALKAQRSGAYNPGTSAATGSAHQSSFTTTVFTLTLLLSALF
jgi:hypothetical protein